MELFNYIFLTTIYVVPLFSLFYLGLQDEITRTRILPLQGIVVFLLLAALGTARFATFLPTDSATYSMPGFSVSKDLEFAFSVSLERVWAFIGLTVALFFHFVFYPLLFKKQHKELLAYLYLVGAYGAVSFSIFSDKMLVSIMFIEVAAFFLHAFSLLGDDEGRELELVSYFKRNVFIFSGLFLMLALTLTKFFSESTTILTGLTLYVLSIVCGRHTFRSVANFFTLQIALFLAAYIFWRTFQLEIETNDWLLHSLIYICLAICFAVVSFTRTQRLPAFYWYTLAIICSYFSLKMNSRVPGSPSLLIEDVILILTSGVFVLLMLSKSYWAKKRKSYLVNICGVLLLLAHLSCLAMPYSLVGQIFYGTREYNLFFIVPYFLFVFLASASAIRLIWSAAFLESALIVPEDIERVIEFVPAILLVVLLAINILYSQGILNIANFAPLVANTEVANQEVLLSSIFAAAFVLGSLLGVFLPSSKAFLNYLKKRDATTADFFPRIDPLFLRMAERFVNLPLRFQENGAAQSGKLLGSLSGGVIAFDKEVMRGRLLREMRSLFNSLSFFVRYIHGGYARAYIFYAILAFTIIMMAFLLK